MGKLLTPEEIGHNAAIFNAAKEAAKAGSVSGMLAAMPDSSGSSQSFSGELGQVGRSETTITRAIDDFYEALTSCIEKFKADGFPPNDIEKWKQGMVDGFKSSINADLERMLSALHS